MSTTQTATIQLRIDRQTKTRAQNVFKEFGMNISSAIKQFLNHVLKTHSVPFKARTVNGFTPEYEKSILEEIKAMDRGEVKSFRTVEELMKDLNS